MKLKERMLIWWLNVQPWIDRIKELLSSCYGEIQMQIFNDICKKIGEVIIAERNMTVGELNVHVKSIFNAQTTLDKAIQNIILRKSTEER